MVTYTFATTPDEEQAIADRIDELGGVTGGFCAVAASQVLNGIGPFKNLGTRFTPGTLDKALKNLQK